VYPLGQNIAIHFGSTYPLNLTIWFNLTHNTICHFCFSIHKLDFIETLQDGTRHHNLYQNVLWIFHHYIFYNFSQWYYPIKVMIKNSCYIGVNILHLSMEKQKKRQFTLRGKLNQMIYRGDLNQKNILRDYPDFGYTWGGIYIFKNGRGITHTRKNCHDKLNNLLIVRFQKVIGQWNRPHVFHFPSIFRVSLKIQLVFLPMLLKKWL
jgi:hypothetical protein